MFSTARSGAISTASYFPLEVPEGTEALNTPSPVSTSASTVQFPLEFKIFLAPSEIIFIIN